MWLYQKTVDWSTLTEGISIPVKYHSLIEDFLNLTLQHGDKTKVQLKINDLLFNVTLTNVNFDTRKYFDHPDIIQLRWTSSSPLAKHIRTIFQASFKKLSEYRELKTKGNHAKSPEITETIILLFNSDKAIVEVEYVSDTDYSSLNRDILNISESMFEEQQNSVFIDTSASLQTSYSMQKIRKLNRSMLSYLKNLYNYRCQICGIEFEKYGAKYIEAHHIIPFVQSINNNSDNILILCPNHHRVVHCANPIFQPEKHLFIYPNGLKETLLINKHIEIT